MNGESVKFLNEEEFDLFNKYFLNLSDKLKFDINIDKERSIIEKNLLNDLKERRIL